MFGLRGRFADTPESSLASHGWQPGTLIAGSIVDKDESVSSGGATEVRALCGHAAIRSALRRRHQGTPLEYRAGFGILATPSRRWRPLRVLSMAVFLFVQQLQYDPAMAHRVSLSGILELSFRAVVHESSRPLSACHALLWRAPRAGSWTCTQNDEVSHRRRARGASAPRP